MSDAQGVPAGGSGLSVKTYTQSTFNAIVRVRGRTSVGDYWRLHVISLLHTFVLEYGNSCNTVRHRNLNK